MKEIYLSQFQQKLNFSSRVVEQKKTSTMMMVVSWLNISEMFKGRREFPSRRVKCREMFPSTFIIQDFLSQKYLPLVNKRHWESPCRTTFKNAPVSEAPYNSAYIYEGTQFPSRKLKLRLIRVVVEKALTENPLAHGWEKNCGIYFHRKCQENVFLSFG